MQTERSGAPLLFDPRQPGFLEDPYPYYADLRAAGPVCRSALDGDWLALGYQASVQVLSDPRFIKGPAGPIQPPPAFAHLPELQPSMLLRDPPDHTRLRGLVNRAFTPHVVEGLRPRVERLAADLLERVAGNGRMDVMADFAFDLPATVIAEMLGVPVDDRERFRAWSQRIIALLDSTQPEEARQQGAQAQLELLDYFHHLVARRRAAPQDDLIGGLLAAEEAGDRLSAGEVLMMCSLLLTAGHETTTNLIGGGTLALLRHPDQLALLRARPDLLPGAVEELLRFSPPVHLDGRLASADVELGPAVVRAGEWALAVIGAANRDPAVFADPERLDLTRARNPHLAFGRGIHYCLGAPLARLEAQVAFGALLRRFPDLSLDPDRPPVWNGNIVIRGLRQLGVRWGA
jgi:cytochrome P450